MNSFPQKNELPRMVWLILGFSLLFRFALSAFLGTGFDEAYYFVYWLNPDWSYFDHPPMVMALAGLFPFLTDWVSPLTLRLGTVFLFTYTSFLFWVFSRRFVSEKASLFSVGILNLAPLFFIGLGIAVLPDAALAFFWILTLTLFAKLIRDEKPALDHWLLAGLFSGLALLCKYHAVLLIGLFLLWIVLYRRQWLRTAGPYVYLAVSGLLFFPVIFWNLQHDFISFRFQSGRALGSSISLDSFLQAQAGQAAYLTPMIFIPMLVILWKTFWRGIIRKDKEWTFYFFFGSMPVLFFNFIALFRPILPHWTLAGYILLCIPLGKTIAEGWAASKNIRRFAWITLLLIVSLLALAFFHIRYGVLHFEKMAERGWVSQSTFSMDATIDMLGWDEVGNYLWGKGYRPGEVFLFSHKWYICGQAAVGSQGKYPVLCFSQTDARGFGIWDKRKNMLGKDGICVYTGRERVDAAKEFGEYFEEFMPADSVVLYRGGVPSEKLFFCRGKNLIKTFPVGQE